MDATISIRRAAPADDAAIARLSGLDSTTPPAAPTLVAEVGGEMVAAISVADGAVVADPFRPSAGIVGLLHLRREQLAPARPRRRSQWSMRRWSSAPIYR